MTEEEMNKYWMEQKDIRDSRKAYEDAIKSKSVIDKSGPIPEGVGAEALEKVSEESSIGSMGKNMGSQMATQGAQSGNMSQLAGGAMMMSGHPALMAGGLGLQVLAAGEANKRAQEEKQRQEYNARIARRQQMLQQIGNMSI